MVKRGLVVSDLHLLSKRSIADALLSKMQPQLERCDVLVLNGDTFNFQWSTLADQGASIAAAIAWLELWSERFAGRQLHFVMGNHDCLNDFRSHAEQLMAQCPQFYLHEFFVLFGGHLFLHGDCTHRRMNVSAMKKSRGRWSRESPRGRCSVRMYDLLERTGLCGVMHRRVFPRELAVSRLAHYLDDALPEWRGRVSDCYFGHTHLPFRDYPHHGVRFHNTGSAICGMQFQPLEFVFE